MKVLQAHQARVAKLQEALEAAMGLELVLLDACAESWRLQETYTPEKEPELRQAHTRIAELQAQIYEVCLGLGPADIPESETAEAAAMRNPASTSEPVMAD